MSGGYDVQSKPAPRWLIKLPMSWRPRYLGRKWSLVSGYSFFYWYNTTALLYLFVVHEQRPSNFLFLVAVDACILRLCKNKPNISLSTKLDRLSRASDQLNVAKIQLSDGRIRPDRPIRRAMTMLFSSIIYLLSDTNFFLKFKFVPLWHDFV